MTDDGRTDARITSDPASGAVDVEPDVGRIRLVFDRAMKQDSWTLWMSEQGELPPLQRVESTPWTSPRVFEVRVGSLSPGTAYAIQLNSPTRQGFQSEDGAALPITVVAFTVAGAMGNILYVRQEIVAVPELGANQTIPIGKIFVMTGDGRGQIPFIDPGTYVHAGTPW